MVRRARIGDVKAIHALLQTYGTRGELLSRPLSLLYDHLRDFFVYTPDDRLHEVLGCCALQFCWEELAEIRSLAVAPAYQRQHMGTQLVTAALAEAHTYGITKVFTLTYRPDFFSRFDFRRINRNDLPHKIWADCIVCVKFPDCDEIAMLKELAEEASPVLRVEDV